MKIDRVTYLENGYFHVLYNNMEVVQDINGIKMTVPTDKSIKDILLFLRKIKLEKLTNTDFDETQYRNHIIYYDNSGEELLKNMYKLMSSKPLR